MQRALKGISLLLLYVFFILNGCSRQESAPTAPRAASPSATPAPTAPSGEALFKQYCATCHPDGGNASDPGRTLRGPVLKKNHITSADDIIRVMRNPISRMIRFDVSTLSDRDARAIAEYILTTFK
jgi:cytochrome c6